MADFTCVWSGHTCKRLARCSGSKLIEGVRRCSCGAAHQKPSTHRLPCGSVHCQVMDGVLVFADHVEARQMGEHTRELRFPEPISLKSINIIRRGERVDGFEGRTYPDIRMTGLEVFVADVLATSSTMLAVPSTSLGSYSVPGQLITNSVVFRGKFIKLSIAIYGEVLPSETHPAPQLPIAQHLRPSSTFEDKLDMADLEDMREEEDDFKAVKSLEFGDEDRDDLEASALSFGRALGLGAVQEANTRLGEHVTWVASLQETNDILEADAVARLEALAQDIVTLAQRAPESAAHLSLGPGLARSLLSLVSRCLERLELRPLRAALQALATCLISATAATEFLCRKGGLDLIMSLLKDQGQSVKLAALQVLLHLCSHVAGVEAVLGWDTPTAQSAYEVVLSLVLDGMPGQPNSELVALALLRRAGLYEALARFDDSCSKLEGDVSVTAPEKFHKLAAETLRNVSRLLEQLSQPMTVRDVQNTCLLLEEDLLSSHLVPESKLPAVIFGGGGMGPVASDPFAQGQNHLYGFLEAFLTGRRLLPGLCTLLRRLPRLPPEDRLEIFRPFQHLLCTLLSCTGGPQFLAADNATLTSLQLGCILQFYVFG